MSNPYISLLKTSWRYARNERKKFVLIYALFILANIAYAVNPILFGWFVGKVQQNSDQVFLNALQFAGALVGIKLLQWAFHGPARVMEMLLSFNISRNFLQARYHQALHLPVKWHQDHHSGATINRIRKAYESLKKFFQDGFAYLYTFSKLVFSIAAMLWFSPLFGAIGVGLGILTIWIISKFDKPFIKTLEEVNEKDHVINATLFDSLSNIMTVLTLRLEKSMEKGLLSKVRLMFFPYRKNVVINEWKWFVADTLVTVVYAVLAAGYVYQNWEPGKVFPVAGLVTLLGFVNQFTSVFWDVSEYYTEIMQNNTNVQTAQSIEDDYYKQHRNDETPDLPANWKTIEISNINFSHRKEYNQEYAPQSLHNLHIRIVRGERIALIGESGSGKSTLLSLLRGLYNAEPSIKTIVDGQPTDIAVVNDSVTLFPQEPEIFENTINYNITLGLPFSEEDVMNVSNTAHFTDVVHQLPNGLESDIREKGVNLSGGQKQRLALARGILAARESDLVLLDEPTSSVDPKTEAMIYEKMFEAFKDKAIISSMHRLHLLNRFDHIYILKQGSIVDQGNFEHLRRNSAIFQELWRHQEITEKQPAA